MPGRLGIAGRRFGGQGGLAVGADRGHIGHDDLDPLGREPMAMMSGMSWLPARLASAGRLDHRLGGPRRIGRRGRGGVGGVAIELAAEFVDFGLQTRDQEPSLVQRGPESAAFRTGGRRARGKIGHSETIRDRTKNATVEVKSTPHQALSVPREGLNGYRNSCYLGYRRPPGRRRSRRSRLAKRPLSETRRMPPRRSPRRADPRLAIPSQVQSLTTGRAVRPKLDRPIIDQAGRRSATAPGSRPQTG